MGPSTSGLRVGAAQLPRLEGGVPAVLGTLPMQALVAAGLHCSMQGLSCSRVPTCRLPLPLPPIVNADLSEVVTRVGLSETELDLVDSLGVSACASGWLCRVARASPGLPTACGHMLQAMSILAAAVPPCPSAAFLLDAPRCSSLSLLPPAALSARRRRCRTRCRNSWCGVAATLCCYFGR